jgi:HlyD family secretion protein/adhesin transport system membrane fusion protein
LPRFAVPDHGVEDGEELSHAGGKRELLRFSGGEQPGRHPLLPGMTVEAAIKTGERSLITYLLRPVRRAFQSGLGER